MADPAGIRPLGHPLERRRFMVALAGSLLTAPVSAAGQPDVAKTRKVGFLPSFGTPEDDLQQLHRLKVFQKKRGSLRGTLYGALSGPRLESLWSALRLTERVEIVVAKANSSSLGSRVDQEAAELVRLSVEVIVSVGTRATIAASQATKTIPIVMVGVADPVAQGLVQSLAKPGGNITGLSLLGPEVLAKGLGLLVAAVPKATRIGVMWNPRNPGAVLSVNQMMVEASSSLKLTLVPIEVEVEPKKGHLTFHSSTNLANLHALVVVGDPEYTHASESLLNSANAAKLPTMFQSREWVDAGGLMAYEPDYTELVRDAASYVLSILGGTKPEDLPVRQPRKFDFIINQKTATTIGLNIPRSVLQQADEVLD